jgi:hypothetical protein
MTESQESDGDRSTIWCMLGLSSSGTAVDRRNNRLFTIWCIAWALGIIAAAWIVRGNDALPGKVAWLIAASPNVLALGALVSYMRFLRMTDELQRRIQIEGLAVGFGVGWIFAIGYLVLQAAGAPELPVTAMILVMTGGWILGTTLAVRHYR